MRFNRFCQKGFSFLFPLITIALFLPLTGCAPKRMAGIVSVGEQKKANAIIQEMQDATKTCPDTIIADAKLFWNSPLGDRAVEGYLQLQYPANTKFIISNPLGQPLFAFARRGKKFQILEPENRKHIRGKIRSLAIRHEIPMLPATGSWFSYLSGQLPRYPLILTSLMRDSNNAGVWLRLSEQFPGNTEEGVYVRIDLKHKQVKEYLFLNSAGESVLKISYSAQTPKANSCVPMEEIHISGLPWGTEITLLLEDISTELHLGNQDFALPVPGGYQTQIWQ